MSSLRLPAASLYLTVIVTGGSDGYGKGIAKILKTAKINVEKIATGQLKKKR